MDKRKSVFEQLYDKAYKNGDQERKKFMMNPDVVKATLTGIVTMDATLLGYIWESGMKDWSIAPSIKGSDVVSASKVLAQWYEKVDALNFDVSDLVNPSQTFNLYEAGLVSDKDGNIIDGVNIDIEKYREMVNKQNEESFDEQD